MRIEVVDAMHTRFRLHELDAGPFETVPAVDDPSWPHP
jgi:hypothetical protein